MKADLHIHTLLSPCGDIEMTPAAIIRIAKERGLDIIGITDHNSTRQASIIKEVGEREGVHVVCGAEITTKEEIHVLAYVNGEDRVEELQHFLTKYLIKIPNDPTIFGYQLVVNEQEEILYQENNLLIGAIDRDIDEVARFIHSLEGIFIPAHIDKKTNSLISQLGYIPPNLEADAYELSGLCDRELFLSTNNYLSISNFIYSSDAHYTHEIGKWYTQLDIGTFSFEALNRAIKKL